MKLLRYLLTISLLATCLLGTAARAEETAVPPAPEPEIDGYIVEIDVPVRLLSASDSSFPEMSEVYAPASVYQAPDASTVNVLRAWGVLRSVEPNYVVTLDDTPSLQSADDDSAQDADDNSAQDGDDDSAQDGDAVLLDASGDEYPWYMSALDMDWVRAQGIRGGGVRVGIIDSGLYAEHQEFQGVKVLSGANYCVSKTDANRSNVVDTLGHGTFVSGLIAAAENNAGLVGLSPDVEIVPLKCFEGKNGSIANIAEAIYDAVDTWHCQVINLSLGIEKESAVLRKAIEYADKAGVIMIAAAGNLLSGSHNPNGDPLNYPAAYPEVIGVGSVGSDLSVSYFSYRNASVDVCAPGQNLRGPSYSNATKYVSGYGTSYAAPMVTAAAALTLSARPNMSAAEFRDLLRDTVRDAGDAGYDTAYGYGTLHAGHLLSAATGNLAHQVTLYRQEFSEMDGPTPALLAAAYDENGALLDTLDVSPPVALDREPNTLPILAGDVDDYPEETFRIPGAARWKLFPFDRFTYSPVRASVELYGGVPNGDSP